MNLLKNGVKIFLTFLGCTMHCTGKKKTLNEIPAIIKTCNDLKQRIDDLSEVNDD
jgi:hypothetical protein